MAQADSALEYLYDLKEGRIRSRSQQRCCFVDESTRLDESVASDSSEDESFQADFGTASSDAEYLKPKSWHTAAKLKREAQMQQPSASPLMYNGNSQTKLPLVDLPPRPTRAQSPAVHCRSIQPTWGQSPQILVATPVGPGGQQSPTAHVVPAFWQHPTMPQVAVQQPSPPGAVQAAAMGQKPPMASGTVMPKLGASAHLKWSPQPDNLDPLTRSVRSISTFGGSGSSHNTSQLDSFTPSMLSSAQQGLPWSPPLTPMSMARTWGSSCSAPMTPASVARNNVSEAARPKARTESCGPPVLPAAMQGSAKASYDSYTPPVMRSTSSDQQKPAITRSASYSGTCASVPTPRFQARSVPSSLSPNSYSPTLIPRSPSYSGDSPRTLAPLSPSPPTPRGTPCFGGVLQATPVNCAGDASSARSLPLAHVVAKVGSAPNLLLKENAAQAIHPRATL